MHFRLAGICRFPGPIRALPESTTRNLFSASFPLKVSWTEDTLTVLDQCIQLPGIISALVLDHWRVACSSRGCVALNQLQKMIRIDGAAESIVELLALRLDEQGTEFSSQWPPEPGGLVLEALWPQVQEAWRAKQGWKGCAECLANQAGVKRLYRIKYGGPGTVGAGQVQLEDVHDVGQSQHSPSHTVDDHIRQGSEVGGTTSQTV